MITLNAVTGITTPNVDGEVGNNTPAEGNFTVVNAPAMNVGGLALSPQTGFKNRIINGGMTIDQRNAGAAVTPSVAGPTAQYIMDRFRLFYTAASKITIQQTTDAPPGFTYSAKLTVASSYNPTVADDQYFFGTSFEADNIGDFAFGTASAATATVSFWIKSSVTGTYSLSWVNSANNRSYVQTFTISSANTWEQKAITISGDTSGTWINTGNARHSFVQIMLGNGSNFDTSTVGSWQSANVRATSGSVEFVAQVTGSTMFITGFQLEKGSTATPFEFRSIGQELALCQRYYYKVFPNLVDVGLTGYGAGVITATTSSSMFGAFPVSMRIRPTALEQSGTAAHYALRQPGATNVTCNAVPTFSIFTSNSSFFVSGAVASGLTLNLPAILSTANAAAFLAWSAEL